VTLDQAVERIQFSYPQVYYACHTRHTRVRSGPAQLSERDSEILVHLNVTSPLTLTELASHMDLSRSTLSEALTRLEAFGYVVKAPARGRDRRHIGLLLAKKGVDAVRAASVLESRCLHTALSTLSRADRSVVIDGLELLARACRHGAQPKSKR